MCRYNKLIKKIISPSFKYGAKEVSAYNVALYKSASIIKTFRLLLFNSFTKLELFVEIILVKFSSYRH
jgi:hypothetical protein